MCKEVMVELKKFFDQKSIDLIKWVGWDKGIVSRWCGGCLGS